MSDNATVAELVARAREGDQEAWNHIVERFAPLVWSLCSRFGLPRDQAEDVGQNVWLLLIEHLADLREPAALPGWLATTTRRECLRAAETLQRRRQREMSGDDHELPDEGEDPDAEMLLAERDHAVREAFGQLPAPCRDLLGLLTATPQLPYVEIARRLDMPIGSIGPNRQRCLRKLRQCPAFAAWLGGNAAPAPVGSTE